MGANELMVILISLMSSSLDISVVRLLTSRTIYPGDCSSIGLMSVYLKTLTARFLQFWVKCKGQCSELNGCVVYVDTVEDVTHFKTFEYNE